MYKRQNFPLAFKDIAYHQQQDPKLCKIIEQIGKGNYSDKYTLSKRVLCFRKANGKSLRIIAPEIIKPMLMEYYHSSTIGAHMGIRKTIHRIRKEYHWENMNSEITKFVKQCETCTLRKPARISQVGKLISEIPTTPFSNIYIDCTGPYPRSNIHIMYIVYTYIYAYIYCIYVYCIYAYILYICIYCI